MITVLVGDWILVGDWVLVGSETVFVTFCLFLSLDAKVLQAGLIFMLESAEHEILNAYK